jgi:glutamyl-tRNA synthetase
LRFHVEAGQTVGFDDEVRGRQEFKTGDIGDFIIRRSNGTPAFFFSNAVDDALMEVSLVVRGEDHLTNTPRQLLLLQALGLSAPAYAHIALIVGDDGAPLSKRHGSRTVQDLRNEGFLPIAINNYLARLGHTYESNDLLQMDALVAGFSLARLHRAPARYDEAQLKYWQHEALLNAPFAEVWSWMGRDVHHLVPKDKEMIFVDTIRANTMTPRDARDWATIFFTDDFNLAGRALENVEYAPPAYFEKVLNVYREHAGNPSIFGKELPVPEGRKRATTFQLVRAALTNKEHGPEIARLLEIIPKDRIEKRLETASVISGKH